MRLPVRLSFVQPLRRFAPAPLVGEPLAKRRGFPVCQGLPSVGEVALRSNDGEGKPVSQKYLHSDKHWLLSERCYRCAFCFTIASLPSQSRSARRGRVAAPSVCCAVACILLAAAPTAPPCFRRWRRSSPLPPKGEPWAERPVLCTNTPKTLSERGGLRAKRKKIAFPLAKRGKTRYSIVTV